MEEEMIFLLKIPFINRLNQKIVTRLVDETLEKTRDLYEQKIKLIEQQSQKQITEIKNTHMVTFQQYKKEHDTLVAQIKDQAFEAKKEAEKERKKAIEIHKEAMAMKEKFSNLHFKVKSLYNGIDSIMKSTVIAETEIVNIINSIERDLSFKNLDSDDEKIDSKVKPFKPNMII